MTKISLHPTQTRGFTALREIVPRILGLAAEAAAQIREENERECARLNGRACHSLADEALGRALGAEHVENELRAAIDATLDSRVT